VEGTVDESASDCVSILTYARKRFNKFIKSSFLHIVANKKTIR
jgi:hypothetical protein